MIPGLVTLASAASKPF